jgi:hypothetical protein
MDSLMVESGRPTKKQLVPWPTWVSMVIRDAETPKTELPKVFANIFLIIRGAQNYQE